MVPGGVGMVMTAAVRYGGSQFSGTVSCNVAFKLALLREREREREREGGREIRGLQQHLDLLEQYCQNWALTGNSVKNKIVIFQKRAREIDRDLALRACDVPASLCV